MGDRKPKPEIPSSLGKELFLSCVEKVIQLIEPNGITSIQKCLIEGFAQGWTYEHIARKYDYSEATLKTHASKTFFPLLAQAFNKGLERDIEKVNKANVISLVEEYNRKISDNGTFLQDKLKENKTKINILTELKNNLSRQQQSELNRIIKSYLPDNDNANFEKIIDKIIDSPDKDSLIILFRLTQDSRINSDTRSYIEQTIQELKKLLNITDTDYNAWIAEIPAINPEPDNRENINNYLIIKIDESKSQANTSPEYKFAAWFLQLNISQSQGNNYIPLPVDSSVSKDVYTQKDITNILTKIIEDCHERGGANLNIEFFTNGKLLYTNFESWEYNCFDSLTQLKRTYFVNVRSLTRLGTMYSKMPVYQHWKSRWERLTTNSIDTQTVTNSESYLCQETTLWSNLCASTQEDLEQFFKRSLKYGIPLAVGSRCHAQEAIHRTQINTLLQGIQINQLSTKVQEVRRQSSDNLEDEPEHLGHHLLCFLEDPNRMPPFHYLTSQHLG
ncbi:MAG: hypothetical protein EWV81_00770 [Microcystis aeruginosa Ma_SC_T_19800800_S464]|uniref:Uncharacterized protein n=1 Tax=Microcystis aeruginosa Ma_SC_T_19800800_S464 TaxID=2486257 RepID=A0A552E6Q6_MICAE|nr:MAG: hypothetical protein EWV81_00770 [Microcystis aeruginosa Ma_SC_T_19800800_S464]